MFLRRFKGNGPGTIFLIIVTLLIVWASAFIRLQNHVALNFDPHPMPLYGILLRLTGPNSLAGIIFTLVLVSLMSFLLVNLNTTIFFINERTFVPAVIYILLSGFFPEYQLLNPAIIGAIFLMFAISRIIETFRIQGTAYNFFDAGIFIGIGSLFYANLIWFGLLIFIGIALFRTVVLKEIVISAIGLITTYFLTFGVYYLFGDDLKSLVSTIEYNLFGKPGEYIFTSINIVALSYMGIIIVVSIINLLRSMNTKKVKSRKIFNLFLWLFFLSLSVFFIQHTVSFEMVWITGIPVSYILSHYFVLVRKKLIPEILFSGLFILILLIQILYLK